MTARILVVDDVLPNIKLLEARLSAEYFDVLRDERARGFVDLCAGALRHRPA
jgi:two-component system cell cycle response regulator